MDRLELLSELRRLDRMYRDVAGDPLLGDREKKHELEFLESEIWFVKDKLENTQLDEDERCEDTREEYDSLFEE